MVINIKTSHVLYDTNNCIHVRCPEKGLGVCAHTYAIVSKYEIEINPYGRDIIKVTDIT